MGPLEQLQFWPEVVNPKSNAAAKIDLIQDLSRVLGLGFRGFGV